MSYGLKLFNNFGELMLSTENKSMHFIGRFASTWSTSFWSTTFSCPTVPLVFVEGRADHTHSVHTLINNGNGTWTCRHNCFLNYTPASSSAIYVFAPAYEHTSSQYGIKVMDANSVPMFDSGKRILVPTGAFTSFAESDPNPLPTINLDWGSIPANWAVSVSNLGTYGLAGQTTPIFALGVKFNSATSVIVRPTLRISQIPQTVFFMKVAANIQGLFIDTTMYQ